MKAGLILSTCVFTALECTLSNIHERENINDQNLKSASKVWRGLVQPKAELLMWFVIYGRLNTKNHLQRLNILRGDNYGCVLCNAELETISHLFFMCNFSWKVWGACCEWWGIKWVNA